MRLSVIDFGMARHALRLATVLDNCGYTRYWATEHRSEGQSASPTTLAAIVAARTQGLRVGTAGVRLCYRRPLSVAEDFSLLESLFPRRIDLGVINGRDPTEAIHVSLKEEQSCDFGERVTRLQGWLEQTPSDAHAVSTRGMHAVPHLWVCGLSESSARLAGELSAKLAYSVALAQLRPAGPDPAILETYRAYYRGRLGSAPESVIVLHGACASSEAEAVTLWQTVSRPNIRPQFIGSPAQCREQIDSLAWKYGVDEVVLHCGHTSVLGRQESYAALGEEYGLPIRSSQLI